MSLAFFHQAATHKVDEVSLRLRDGNWTKVRYVLIYASVSQNVFLGAKPIKSLKSGGDDRQNIESRPVHACSPGLKEF